MSKTKKNPGLELVEGVELPDNGRIKIGEIGVDAGMCWLGDPCYVFHTDIEDAPKALGKDWQEFVNFQYAKVDNGFSAYTYHFNMGHEGLGVCVSTGYGDGVYPVYVTMKDGRVKKVEVIFF